MMPFGFIVARIKFKNESVYHCVDKYNKHRFLLTREMISGLDSGEYLNGSVVGTGKDAYIRLGKGIPTIEEDRNFDRAQFGAYKGYYMSAKAPSLCDFARKVAAKRRAVVKNPPSPRNRRAVAVEDELLLEKAHYLTAATSPNPTGALSRPLSLRKASLYAVIGWLLEHPQAAKDAFRYMGRDVSDLQALEEDLGRRMPTAEEVQKLSDWFADHEGASKDFVAHFKKSPSEFLA